MHQPRAEANDPRAAQNPSTSPPIRMIHAFQLAVESSQPESDPSAEAFVVEVLVIAGETSYAALSRLDALFFQINYGDGGPTPLVDRVVIEEGYEAWLDAAELLLDRINALELMAYESESFASFRMAQEKARSFLNEARERRRLERQALGSEQLAQLAGRFKSSQTTEDVPEVGR